MQGGLTPEPSWSSPNGDAVIYHGDARDIIPRLEPKVADCLLADPPFAIENQFGKTFFDKNNGGMGGTRAMQFDWDNPETAAEVAEIFRLTARCLKPSSAIFVFCGFDTARIYSDPFREAGFCVKPAAWVKKCPAPAGKGNWWPSGFELAFYGYRKSPWFGDDNPKRTNVFLSDSMRHGQPGKVDHPTQKPLGLVKRLVLSSCAPGGIVLDPTCGSGTTGVACIQTGRRFIGIEKERHYVDIAVERLEEALGVGTLFAEVKE